VPRNVGLLMGPTVATVIFAILIVTAHSQTDGGSSLPTGLIVALALMLANQIGALRAAQTRSTRP
jgi:hypothetical protein